MFFLMKLKKEIILSPQDLKKPDLKRTIKGKLIEKVIGNCTEKYGYFIKVIDPGEIPNGYIMDTTGDIVFNIEYRVVVMRPFKGEICEGEVERILPDNAGMHVRAGPMIVFISDVDIPPNFRKDNKNNNYVSENETISQGDKLRFKFKEIQFDNDTGGFRPIGTIRENFLGKIDS